MMTMCLRAAAAALTMGCALLLATPWQAQAAPIVFHNVTNHGTGDDLGRFTAVLGAGANPDQTVLQLFTAPGSGARISTLYVQDTAGAVARDDLSGGPKVQLSPTQLYDVRLDAVGASKVAVIKVLSRALGIDLSAAKQLVDGAPTVIRTTSTPDGNAQLKAALETAGATVSLSSRPDPAVPAGTNAGVAMTGMAPTGYDVVLSAVGGNKVGMIKVVRDLTGLSLADAKKLVDGVPSVIKANASPSDAVALRQALQGEGGTVELDPIGGSAAQGPIVLPPGSAGIVPDIGLGFDYLDPGATPTLQLTFDLDLTAADLLSAWLDGRFVMGLGVTNAAGVADLYLAGVDVPPQQGGLPEPSTLALLSVPLLVLARGAARRRQGSAASFVVG